MKSFSKMTVGEIVADDFKYARVFDHYKIDFCCNGARSLSEACRHANVSIDDVIGGLNDSSSENSTMVDFKSWPTDLLVDFVLKFHHRNIRLQGPGIVALLDKVCHAHGDNHPELYDVRMLFVQSIADLDNHLQKEEMVLFPYIYELCASEMDGTPTPSFHCGTIESPISVMMSEHDAEGERYRTISQLTHGYTAPDDACGSYRLVLEKLKGFEEALHHHIHLENNIIFPRALKMESGSKH